MKSSRTSLILIICILVILEEASVSASHQKESDDSTKYVKTEVLNFNKGTTNDQHDASLPIAECNWGIFTPDTMNIYKDNWYHCSSACSNGCTMAKGAYQEDPKTVPLKENRVICYIMKVQANFRIARLKKVTTRGKVQRFYQCRCGLYIGHKFTDCADTMFVKYAEPDEYPIDLPQKEDGEMRLACLLSCNGLDAMVSMKSGKIFLVGCGKHKHIDQVLDYRTYALEGYCTQRDGDVKCVCGIPITKKITWNCEDPLMRLTKKIVYHLNMTASVRVRDDRVYNLRKFIYEPEFFIPPDCDVAHDCFSRASRPAPKYKKTVPSIGHNSPSTSTETVEFVKMKREVETIHGIGYGERSLAPPEMYPSSFNAQNFVSEWGEQRSVNQLAVQKSWVTEPEETNTTSYVSKIGLEISESKEEHLESKEKILESNETILESTEINSELAKKASNSNKTKSKIKVTKSKKEVSEYKKKVSESEADISKSKKKVSKSKKVSESEADVSKSKKKVSKSKKASESEADVTKSKKKVSKSKKVSESEADVSKSKKKVSKSKKVSESADEDPTNNE